MCEYCKTRQQMAVKAVSHTEQFKYSLSLNNARKGMNDHIYAYNNLSGMAEGRGGYWLHRNRGDSVISQIRDNKKKTILSYIEDNAHLRSIE